MQGLSGPLYEFGKMLFADAEEEDDNEQQNKTTIAEGFLVDEDQDQDEDETSLDDLLSRWTTLPAQGQVDQTQSTLTEPEE
jgi:hypothetical protein